MPLTPLMEKRLRRAFKARRIAVVGASPDQLSIGMGPMHNLLSSGFEGEVFPVNPKYTEVLGCKCYPDLESIDPPPDLAVLMLNQHLAVEMAERAARHGVGAVTIVVGGFGEVGVDGESLHQRLKEIAQRYEVPVIGPNTLGFCCFHSGQNGIFWHFTPLPGKIALLSQSGGVGLTIAYCLQGLHCGLSHFVGVGNRTVVDFSDYLQILGDDSEIAVFVLFIEGVDCPRALYESVKEAALSRPVVVYKAGKNEVVSRATATHTGALTGEYQLYKSMFRQAGAVEVSSCQDAAIAAKALSMAPAPAGNRLCALTFTAGPCIVAMDKLVDYGWELPELALESRKKILSIIGENTPVEIQNPVDLTGPGFIPKNYISVLETLLRDDFDAYLVVWSFSPLIRMPAIELEMLIKKYAEKSVVLVVMGSPMETAPYVERLAFRGICVYATPEDGALALNALISRRRFLRRESSHSTRTAIHSWQRDKGVFMVLPEYEANKLLSDNGIPVIRIAPVDSVENAIKIAGEFGCPVALKFSSARYPHKTELGGVCLNLSGEKDLRGAFEQLQSLKERLDPGAKIIMEPMIPEGAELFIGYQLHAQFGPVISVGLGGVFLELTKDVAFRLLPARRADFAEMLSELRSWPKLKKGFRNLQPVEESHILSLMQRVSEFALSRPDVAELDLNPVIARPDGAWAVDARVRVRSEE